MEWIFMLSGVNNIIMGIIGVYKGATQFTYLNLVTGLIWLVVAFIIQNYKISHIQDENDEV